MKLEKEMLAKKGGESCRIRELEEENKFLEEII